MISLRNPLRASRTDAKQSSSMSRVFQLTITTEMSMLEPAVIPNSLLVRINSFDNGLRFRSFGDLRGLWDVGSGRNYGYQRIPANRGLIKIRHAHEADSMSEHCGAETPQQKRLPPII